jgi:hypothetical protein
MRGERGEGRGEREEMRDARYNQASDGAVRRAGNRRTPDGEKRGRERERDLGRMNYANYDFDY